MRVPFPGPAVGSYVTPGTRQARLSPQGNRTGKAAWLMYTKTGLTEPVRHQGVQLV